MPTRLDTEKNRIECSIGAKYWGDDASNTPMRESYSLALESSKQKAEKRLEMRRIQLFKRYYSNLYKLLKK